MEAQKFMPKYNTEMNGGEESSDFNWSEDEEESARKKSAKQNKNKGFDSDFEEVKEDKRNKKPAKAKAPQAGKMVVMDNETDPSTVSDDAQPAAA